MTSTTKHINTGIRVGVDVGGTFTDLVLEDTRSGRQRIFVHKVASTLGDQSDGVLKGIVELCKIADVKPAELNMVFHGTTVATNMAIERDGAEVGMITTKGFRDILHMARHKRPQNFSLQFQLPWQTQPLVKRRNRIAVSERILPPHGDIEVDLNEDEVRAAAELFKKRNIEAVVIAFLFSFLNDKHESRAAEIVREVMPNAYISTSSSVVNVMREYERFSTTAMNAYIGPRTERYLKQLESKLRGAGIAAPIRIMQSNGGISTVENSSNRPVGLLLSGPAGGVIGAKSTGESCGAPNIITIDIGGTSADISVIRNGQLSIKNPRDTQIAHLPVLVPMLDIDAIGAGGGSVAQIDAGGAFRVGPRSAGAFPGPACYGQGGTEPTVTDAQLVLGRLDPEQFLGGNLKIDPKLSYEAVKTQIAEKLNISVEQAALGILRIVNNTMALAVNANSVSKGIDPRAFTLMAFGGAGPLHGVALSEIIGTKDVISPLYPGITAAVGLLEAELQYDFTRSTLVVLDKLEQPELDRLEKVFAELVKEADLQLAADNIPAINRSYQRIVECRYLGQGFELRANVPDGPLNKGSVEKVIENFSKVHEEVYGHYFTDQSVEVVTVRVIARGATDLLRLPAIDKGGRQNPAEAYIYSRPTIFDDGVSVETPRYARDRLLADDCISGPAIVTQNNSTTVVPPGWKATVLSHGDILLSH